MLSKYIVALITEGVYIKFYLGRNEVIYIGASSICCNSLNDTPRHEILHKYHFLVVILTKKKNIFGHKVPCKYYLKFIIYIYTYVIIYMYIII